MIFTAGQDNQMNDLFGKEIVNESDSLRDFAFHFTRCHHAAEDLLQETYLKAWKNKDEFRKGTSIRAWLFTIMRNTFINQYRMRHKTLKRKSEVPMVEGVEPQGVLSVDQALAQRDLANALNRLPQVFGSPLRLYMEGYRYREISDLLQVPVGTIKCRIHFARKLVKKLISL